MRTDLPPPLPAVVLGVQREVTIRAVGTGLLGHAHSLRGGGVTELPMPRFLPVAPLPGPVRVDPAIRSGVSLHPLVLRRTEVVDTAAQVDRDAPAVVRRTGAASGSFRPSLIGWFVSP